jgi:hypothetical protein
MCKPLDLNRPLQVRRGDAYHKDEVRPAKLLDAHFLHQRGNECALVQFKCSDGSDTVQVFSHTGDFVFALHSAVRGFSLENVPQKMKVYIYDVTTPSGKTYRTSKLQPVQVNWTAGVRRWQYKLLKEVEVEL